MSPEEKVAAALEAIDLSLSRIAEGGTDDLLEGQSREAVLYGEGFRDGIRTALERVREVLR